MKGTWTRASGATADPRGLSRRRFLGAGGALALGAASWALVRGRPGGGRALTVYTFGDSILDCGAYNELGVHPGKLLVRNEDRLFPEFRGQDLTSRGPARLDHRARNGARAGDLRAQARGLEVDAPAVALLTVGGNDLLGGLVADTGEGLERFAATVREFLEELPIRPVLVGNVYDPTFGDDSRNFLAVDPPLARASHARVNSVLAGAARRYGMLVDLHAHFLRGDPSWFVHTIEPSLLGASEIRRCFLCRLIPTAPVCGSFT